MRVFSVAIALFLVGCSSEPSDDYSHFDDDYSLETDAIGSEPVGLPAQDSTAALASSPSEYSLLRAASSEYYDDFGQEFFPVFDDESGSYLDIYECELSEQFGGLQLTAMYAEGLSRRLASLGFPADLYGSPIADFEQESLSLGGGVDAINAHADELAARIDQQRRQLAPNLPAIVVEEGCGAGEVPVIFTSSSANARVFLMNALDFKICKRRLRGKDPYAIENCRWLEASNQRPLPVAGRLEYQVRTQAGEVITGNTLVSPQAAFDEDAEILQVRLP